MLKANKYKRYFQKASLLMEATIAAAVIASVIFIAAMAQNNISNSVSNARSTAQIIIGYDELYSTLLRDVKSAETITGISGNEFVLTTGSVKITYLFEHRRIYRNGTELCWVPDVLFQAKSNGVEVSLSVFEYGTKVFSVYR